MIVSGLLTFITVGQKYKYLCDEFIIVIPEECASYKDKHSLLYSKIKLSIVFYSSILDIFNI